MKSIQINKAFCKNGSVVKTAIYEVLVDDEDYATVSKMPWAYCLGYATTNRDYKERQKGGPRKISMHKLLLKPPDGHHVHHINGNKLDNRRSNLMVMSASDHIKFHKSKSVAHERGKKAGRRKLQLDTNERVE
jgi:hypothetical protein